MAARATTPEKRPGIFSQIKTLYSFTARDYKFLPWLLAGVLVAGVGLGLLLGFLIQPVQWWTVLLWSVTGLLAGVLAALMTMTRLSTASMYKQLDGRPGAVGHIISTSLGRKWQANDQPVGVNPKTQDAVYRVIGRGGVVVIGEGSKGRLARLVGEEKSKVSRVAQGVPVTVFYVGHGEGEVALKDLPKSIKALPTKLDRGTMAAVIKRVDSVSQSLASLPIPKGIDPQRVRAQRPR